MRRCASYSFNLFINGRIILRASDYRQICAQIKYGRCNWRSENTMILPLKLSLYLKVFAARDAKWRIWRHINFGTFAFLLLAGLMPADAQSFLAVSLPTGFSGTGNISLSRPLTLRWQYASEATVNLAPVVAQKQIYLPLASGVIVSLSSVDGALFWKSEIGGEVSAVPSADERGVYLASATAETAPQNSSSRDSSSGVLRALGRESGVTLWRRTLSSPIQGALATTQTTIYGGARDGHLYAVQKNTGEILWARQFPAAFNSCPLADGSRLYIGAEDGTFAAVNQKTGDTLWRYRTHGAVRGNPVLLNGFVFFGSMDGYVYALGAADGRLRWRTRTGAGVQSLSNTIGGLIAPSLDNFVYMLSFARGNRLWKHQMAGRVAAAPLITIDGALFTPIAGDIAIVLDLRDGKQLNVLPLGADGATAAAPVLANNILLLTTRHGLLAFAQADDAATRSK